MYDLELALTQIYNALSLIDTHGEATIRMAFCLESLGEMIQVEANRKAAAQVDKAEEEIYSSEH